MRSVTKMNRRYAHAAALMLALCAGLPAGAQEEGGGGARNAPIGPIQGDTFHTRYLRMPGQGEGLLYEPTTPRPRVALIFTHPSRNNFNDPIGRQMAMRGYRVMMVNYRGDPDFREANPDAYLPSISQAVTYLRHQPGVERVVLIGHSGGGHLAALYGAISEKGPAFCSGPEKIYPCKAKGLADLAKLDGVILLDPTLGAFHQMSAVDPAIAGTPTGAERNPALDMFNPANGYDPAAHKATYEPGFVRKFYAAQALDNAHIVDDALARLHAIEAGKGEFSDDEPLVIKGMGVRSSGARLYQPDTAFAAHTKHPHLLLRPDGTGVQTIVQSVRQPAGRSAGEALRSLDVMVQNTTVRRFLAASAIRTRPDYAITADDIVGVDWNSSYNSTPAMAEGITVPTLVVTMSCHYLIMPGEIIFDHLGSKDKSYASVEGAVHTFTPCKPEYGDTTKRTFDFVDGWLSQGRFGS